MSEFEPTAPDDVPAGGGVARAVHSFDGRRYQATFDALAANGHDVHGEATLVLSFHPVSVLDAGCGTGRVARELARHGVTVVGVDIDASMIAEARRLAPKLTWIDDNLATMSLERRFDVVVLAGNVPLFCPAHQRAALVATCAAHVERGGALICGFELGRGFDLGTYDALCRDAGVHLVERWSTWDCESFVSGSSYAVSVHAC